MPTKPSKSAANIIVNDTVSGTPASTDLILYAPLPNTPLVTDAKHSTIAAAVAAANAAAGSGLVATKILNNAEIIHLPTTPITIVTGIPGFAILPVFAFAAFTWAVNYASIDAVAKLRIISSSGYGSLADIRESNNTEVSVLLANGGDSVATFPANGSIVASVLGANVPGATMADFRGLPLVVDIDNNGAVILTGGDVNNSLKITVFYTTVPV